MIILIQLLINREYVKINYRQTDLMFDDHHRTLINVNERDINVQKLDCYVKNNNPYLRNV